MKIEDTFLIQANGEICLGIVPNFDRTSEDVFINGRH